MSDGWRRYERYYILFLIPYTTVCFASLLWSPRLELREVLYGVSFLLGLALLPFMTTLIEDGSVDRWLCVTATVGVAVLWSIRLMWGEMSTAHRLHAAFLPTALGVMLVVPIVLSVGFRQRLLGAVVLIAALVVLLPTNARGPTLAAAVGVLVVLLCQRRYALLVGAVCILLVITMAGRATLLSDPITSYLELDSVTRGLGSGASGRTELWRHGIGTFEVNPYLGVGFRNPDASAHGGWITLLAETGLLGLLPVLALYIGGTVGVVTRIHEPWSPAALGLVAAVLFMSVWESLTVNLGNPTSLVTLTLLCTGLSATRDQEAPPRIRT